MNIDIVIVSGVLGPSITRHRKASIESLCYN